MDIIEPLLSSFAACCMVMTVLWYFAWRLHRIDLIDIGWACCIGGASVWYAASLEEISLRHLLVVACPVVWATRLCVHLIRRVRTVPEDPRYGRYRQIWGESAGQKFLFLYLGQATLAFALSIPIYTALTIEAGRVLPSDYVGLIIFLLSFLGVYVADRELSDFKQVPSNKGKLCKQGLWRYSRHPNYFFEWITWWSYVAFAIASPYWWVSLLGPGIMYYLLVYITGIPPAEAQSIKSKPDEYMRYQKETSAFFPWFVR